MIERLFRLLFKYPPLVFEQGNLAWGVSRPGLLAIAAAAALAITALLTYRAVSGERRGGERPALIALRVAIVALLSFCLLRPTLTLKASVPQQNFVGILVDDSHSMEIADRDNQPRSAFVKQQLASPTGPLLNALSQKFVVRFFRFSSSAERMITASIIFIIFAGLVLVGSTRLMSTNYAG